MIVTCPECATRYDVDDAAFSSGGRAVRCNHCGCEWYQIGPAHAGAPAAAVDDAAGAERAWTHDAEPKALAAPEALNGGAEAPATAFDGGYAPTAHGLAESTDGGGAGVQASGDVFSRMDDDGAAFDRNASARDDAFADEDFAEDEYDPTDPDAVADGHPAEFGFHSDAIAALAPPEVDVDPELPGEPGAEPLSAAAAPPRAAEPPRLTDGRAAPPTPRPERRAPPAAPPRRTAPPTPTAAAAPEEGRLALGPGPTSIGRERRPVLRAREGAAPVLTPPAAAPRIASPTPTPTPAAAPGASEPARKPADADAHARGRRRGRLFVAASFAAALPVIVYHAQPAVPDDTPIAGPALSAYREQVDLILAGAPAMLGVENGLVFVEYRYDLVDGPDGPALEVWGRVANNGPDVAFSPTIEIVSRDENGEALQRWPARLESERLGVGEVARFSSRMMFPDGPVYDVDFYIAHQ